MSLFNSKRERLLWILAAVVQTAIYLTLGLAGDLARILRDYDLSTISFILTLSLVGIAVTLISVRDRKKVGVGMVIGVIAVYWMASVRILALEERTHLFEYSLVATLIFQALIERRKNRVKILVPAILTIGITSILGLIDEAIQFFLPNRIFDWQDVGFNALASLIAVGLGTGIIFFDRRRKEV